MGILKNEKYDVDTHAAKKVILFLRAECKEGQKG